MVKKAAILLILLGLLILPACGSGGDVDKTTGGQATTEFKTPLPESEQAKLMPTNTPLPPPPTPTKRPTSTPAPTETPAPTDTPEPTPTSEPTSATGTSATATKKPTATRVPPTATATKPPPPPVTNIMVDIPAGPFTMGSNDGGPEDAPAHEVNVPAFAIDQFEVINADFESFVTVTGYVTAAEQAGKKSWRDSFGEGEENHPVVRVTWNDAVAYCEWVKKRLPTEAEWEKAARGTEGFIFPWGNQFVAGNANLKVAGLRSPVSVGSYGAGASPYGVDDMAGNVWEWTADWYEPYPGNTILDLYYGKKCRVIRGGGWFDVEAQATTFTRNCAAPDKTATDELGFRCAMSK